MSPKTSPYMSLHPSTSTINLSSHHDHDHDQDQDLEDASSETTLANEGLLSKRSNLASKIDRLNTVLTWLRFSTIVLLQGIIIMMLLPSAGLMEAGWGAVLNGKGMGGGEGSAHALLKPGSVAVDSTVGEPWTAGKTETGGDVNGLYIPTSHTYTLLKTQEERFFPNMSGDSDRVQIRHNWDMLMPLGSGSVAIPDYKNYPNLGQPISDDPIRTGPLFEASWTHALHCLYYHVDNYHQLVTSSATASSPSDLKFGFGQPRNDMHAAHCFEYIRNNILCSADMTLEGQKSLDPASDGQAHMCRDRSEAVRWIEERRVDDLRDIIGP